MKQLEIITQLAHLYKLCLKEHGQRPAKFLIPLKFKCVIDIETARFPIEGKKLKFDEIPVRYTIAVPEIQYTLKPENE